MQNGESVDYPSTTSLLTAFLALRGPEAGSPLTIPSPQTVPSIGPTAPPLKEPSTPFIPLPHSPSPDAPQEAPRTPTPPTSIPDSPGSTPPTAPVIPRREECGTE